MPALIALPVSRTFISTERNSLLILSAYVRTNAQNSKFKVWTRNSFTENHQYPPDIIGQKTNTQTNSSVKHSNSRVKINRQYPNTSVLRKPKLPPENEKNDISVLPEKLKKYHLPKNLQYVLLKH